MIKGIEEDKLREEVGDNEKHYLYPLLNCLAPLPDGEICICTCHNNSIEEDWNSCKHCAKQPWKPEEGEDYWAVKETGKPMKLQWNGSIYDYELHRFNNYFPTRKAAEQARDRIKEVLSHG